MSKNDKISMSVIRRLPRYYRFLLELKNNGAMRVSSRELAEKMGSSASQIRQDLNCFGGFGQQGYGYDVPKLFDEISAILGLDHRYNAILLGVGNLGRAVVNHVAFESRGFNLVALFDKDPGVVGVEIKGMPVRNVAELGDYCRSHQVDAAFLCLPRESVEPLAEVLYGCGVRYYWNFSHFDLTMKFDDVIVENVHLNDSLMTLCYRITEEKYPMIEDKPSEEADGEN